MSGTWTSQTMPTIDNINWTSVCFGNGVYVAVSNYAVMTSPDGVTWTTQKASANNNWTNVSYGLVGSVPTFVAVSDATSGDVSNKGNAIMTSTNNGVTWTDRAQPSPTPVNWKSSCYNSSVGLFAAVSNAATGTIANRVIIGVNTWTAQTAASNDNWSSICSDNTIYVAVSLNGTIMTSSNGTTWTNRTASAADPWTSVCYGAAAGFVAVSSAGTAMYSADGITWTNAASVAAANNWRCVTYNSVDAVYVAVSDSFAGTINNRIMTSPDGNTWTSVAASANNNWTSVCFGTTPLCVAVSKSNAGTISDRIMTSVSGTTTWTNRTGVYMNMWNSICYGGGTFVAVGNAVAATSPDGITWNQQTTAPINIWTSVCYSSTLSLFAAVSNTAIGNVLNRVMTSPDGIIWTGRTAALNVDWVSIASSGNSALLVAVSNDAANNTSQVMTSTDGTTWTIRTVPTMQNWSSIAWGNSLFVAIAYGTVSMKSTDGITWTNVAMPGGYTPWLSVCYGTGTDFVAVSPTGVYIGIALFNGTSWTPATSVTSNAQLSSVCYGNGIYVATANTTNGTSSTQISTSPDGLAWTSYDSGAFNNWYGVTYQNNVFVAVASSGPPSTGATLFGSIACYAKGTNILCVNNQYVKIENLKVGDLVKTYVHGYKKVTYVGYNDCINCPSDNYKCMYRIPENDLTISGGHYLLVNKLVNNGNTQFYNTELKIDGKHLLLACDYPTAEKIETVEKITVYHVVLEGPQSRYGIYANGMLSESTSEEIFKQFRFMMKEEKEKDTINIIGNNKKNSLNSMLHLIKKSPNRLKIYY